MIYTNQINYGILYDILTTVTQLVSMREHHKISRTTILCAALHARDYRLENIKLNAPRLQHQHMRHMICLYIYIPRATTQGSESPLEILQIDYDLQSSTLLKLQINQNFKFSLEQSIKIVFFGFKQNYSRGHPYIHGVNFMYKSPEYQRKKNQKFGCPLGKTFGTKKL